MDWMNVGIGRHMLRLPQTIGRRRVASVAKQAHDVMAGLTDQHRTLHRLMFAELVRVATPLTPETLAEHMHVSVETVGQLLAEIGEQKALIARDKSGSVSWVYPVTVDQTPHRLTFRSGEQLYAAWAADAIAAPFVQGRLTNQDMSVTVETSCHHCAEPFVLEIDSDMNVTVGPNGAQPMVFVPDVVPFDVAGPDIVDDFWRHNVFFWSEEHAREYRKSKHRLRGVYAPLSAVAHNNRILQSAVFGFWSSVLGMHGC